MVSSMNLAGTKTLVALLLAALCITTAVAGTSPQRRSKRKRPPAVACDNAACWRIELSAAEVRQGDTLTASIYFADALGRSWTYEWTLDGEVLAVKSPGLEIDTAY